MPILFVPQKSHAQAGSILTAASCGGLLGKIGGFMDKALSLIPGIGGFLAGGEVPTKENQQRTKEGCLDHIAFMAANILLENATKETVNWINGRSGEGGPKYVQDLGGFLEDVADQTIGDFIFNSDFGFVCDPFKTKLQLSIARARYPKVIERCSLSDVVNNIDNFVSGDFYDGGWNAWGELVTRSNPYSQYLQAESELQFKIDAQRDVELKQLQWGAGFFSVTSCKDDYYVCVVTGEDEPLAGYHGEFDKEACEANIGARHICEEEITTTPGSVVETQLNNTLGLGQGRLQVADEFNEIVSALLNKLVSDVFSKKGLYDIGKPDPNNPDKGEDGFRSGSEDIDPSDLCANYGICEVLPPPGGGPPPPGGGVVDPVCIAQCQSDHCSIEGEAEILTCDSPALNVCIASCPIIPNGNGSCADPGNSTANYRSDVLSANNAVLVANPALANSSNTDSNRFQFISLVAAELQSRSGFNATDEVLNGNNNSNTGDLIAVWKNGDFAMERYDILTGAGSTIQKAGVGTAQFSGDIPLSCTTGGGGPIGGGGGGNDPGAPSSISESDISWIDNGGVGGWDETADLSVGRSGGNINLSYDKANSWPVEFTGSGTAVVANAWIVVWRNGEWVAGTWEFLRPGQTSKSTSNLFGGALRGELSDFRPVSGERYGFVVSTLARNGSTIDLDERSNVAEIIW